MEINHLSKNVYVSITYNINLLQFHMLPESGYFLSLLIPVHLVNVLHASVSAAEEESH